MGAKAKKIGNITQTDAAEFFAYNPESGVVTLRKRSSVMDRRQVGGAVGSADAYGYLVVRFKGRAVKLHRLIWLLVTGEWPDAEIDRVDGRPANNCWDNLREATSTQNSRNRRVRSTAKLGLKGVSSTQRGTFRSVIYKDGKQRFLGAFDTAEEAHAAYVAAAQEQFGEFARAQ